MRAWLLALLFACGPKAPRSAAGPEHVLSALNQAIEAQDPAAAERLSTAGFWTREGDSGQALYAQATERGFTFSLYQRQESFDRAVLTLDVLQAGELVDRVHLYLRQEPGGWRADGVNEVDEMVPLFLQGLVEPDLSLEALPPSPELQALGADLLAGRAALTGTDGPYLQAEIAARTAPRVVSSHWHAATGRGLLRIASEDIEEIWVYLRQTGQGWQALGWSYRTPSLRAFLRTPR